MTEKEAITSWCPMTRFHTIGHAVYVNRGNGKVTSDSANCIASSCMCWVGEGDDHRGVRHGHCGLING